VAKSVDLEPFHFALTIWYVSLIQPISRAPVPTSGAWSEVGSILTNAELTPAAPEKVLPTHRYIDARPDETVLF